MCDTFCLRRPTTATRGAGMLLAKNSDRPVNEAQVVRWFEPRAGGGTVRTQHLELDDPGAPGILGSQPTWLWGLEHGVSAHRVAIGNEKVWTVDDPRGVEPALLGMDLVRLALERATTADEALEVLTSLLADHGQGGSGEELADEPYWSSFLAVDPTGGWVIETSSRSWTAQRVGDGAAISNRLTLGRDWERSSPDVATGSDWDAWRAPDVPTGIADHRLAATRRCVSRGGAEVGPAEAVAALRDHGAGPWGAPGGTAGDAPTPVPDDVRDDLSGISVCMHVRGYQATTASMVAWLPEDPAAPVRAWASLGTPCTAAFLPVLVLDPTTGAVAVPDALGDASAWRASAALSRRVEAPGDEGAAALERIRSVLDPLEAEAWEEADGLGSDPAAWQAATLSWSDRWRDALGSLRGPT